MMQVSCYYGPTLELDERECSDLVQELRECASVALRVQVDDLPDYQCLKKDNARLVLSDKVLTVVRVEGRLVGFTSAVLLDIPPLPQKVLHLGLTCVVPTEESRGLTKLLVGSSVITYAEHKGENVEEIWITNLASVISSLGSVALNFQDVFPSPFCLSPPSETHRHITQSIIGSPKLLQEMYVAGASDGRPIVYDERKSVIVGSTKGSLFAKSAEEIHRGKHRLRKLDDFYHRLIDFERGDEVLQVGRVHMKTARAYRPTDHVKAKL